MATQQRTRRSLWKAFLVGCIPSAVLIALHIYNGVDYQPQTLAGQIAYWVGFALPAPFLFVAVAAIQNAFIPRNAEVQPKSASGFQNFFWPTNIKANAGGIARLGRVLHWLLAFCGAAFIVGGLSHALFGFDALSGLAAAAYGGGACLLLGRGLRYVLSGE